MLTTIVTSFSPAGYEQYGRRFIETFDRFFPGEIDLIVYAEHRFAHNPDSRLDVRPLFGIDICADFVDEYSKIPLACGREVTPAWKAKDRADGYSFKTDAVKFCRKVFAIADAARRLPEARLLVWMDADSFTFAKVPSDFLCQLLGDADVAYLGRVGAHSECGFLAFRMPEAMPLIHRWELFYASGQFIRAREWHDSYLFDLARDDVQGLRYRDLTPGGRGHVWCGSPLGAYIDHLKGNRKTIGYSPERRGKA